MLKRVTLLLLVFVFVLGALGVQATDAAPAEQTIASAPNANLLPADTALYFNFRTSQISDIVKFLQDTGLKVTGQAIPDPFQKFDQHLSTMLGRSASWANDIQPWIGDNFTAGLSITDDQLNSLKAGQQISPDYETILAIKNNTKADAFFKELMTKANPASAGVKATPDKIGATNITIYTQTDECGTRCMTFVQTPSYFAFGSTRGINVMLDTLKNRKPTLAADANFGKIIRTLKPNNLVTVYATPKLYELALSMQPAFREMPGGEKISDEVGSSGLQPGNPFAPNAVFNAINGQAFGLGRNGKVLYIDIAQSVNLDSLASAYSSMGLPANFLKVANAPISSTFTSQIPAQALFALQGHGLGDVYNIVKTTLQNMPQFAPPSGARPEVPNYSQAFTQLEDAFKLVFGSDLQKDVLAWMNGDYVFYMTYDPDSTLAKLNPNGQDPFDYTLIAQTSDPAKTKDFLTKIGDTLNLFGDVTVTSAGTNVYSVTAKSGATFGYGLVGKTFFLTFGSGLKSATDAIKGVGALTRSPIWTQARANTISPTTQLWYVNMNELSTALKALVPADQQATKRSQQVLAFLDLFNSATFTGTPISKDGMSRSSIDLVMK